MNTATQLTPDIDVVITWVDGQDPVHFKKRVAYKDDPQPLHAEASIATRFNSCGEIYVAIASILENINFVRTIWIVTDNQRPEHLDKFVEQGLCDADRIKLVDHTEILGDVDGALPTFNSLSIEAAIWRIKGLAPQFIYFNDDMFVNKPLTPGYFFEADGKPRIHGERFKSDHKRLKIKIRKFLRKITGRGPNIRPSYRKAQELGAQHAGEFGPFIHASHWPHPMRQQTLARFYEDRWEDFCFQVRHRFRSVAQSWPISVAAHLENPDPLLEPPYVGYLRPNRSAAYVEQSVDDVLSDKGVFGCMQSLDEIAAAPRARLYAGLQKKFARTLPIDLASEIDDQQ